MRGKERIRIRIPARIICAVQDAAQLVPVLAQHAIKSTARFRSQDFVFVMFAHGGDAIGEEDSRFEKIESSEKFNATE